MSNIVVSAALAFNANGETLFVRKRNTNVFMQVGGKPNGSETAMNALIREINEEIGLQLVTHDIKPIGTHIAPAANETGLFITANCFWFQTSQHIEPKAEIAEIRWHNPANELDFKAAPLYITHLEKLARLISLQLTRTPI